MALKPGESRKKSGGKNLGYKGKSKEGDLLLKCPNYVPVKSLINDTNLQIGSLPLKDCTYRAMLSSAVATIYGNLSLNSLK